MKRISPVLALLTGCAGVDGDGAAYVTREDCAAAAAAVPTSEGHENRIYEITGPERVRTRDLAVIAGELTGTDIEIIEAGPAQLDSVPAPLLSSATLTNHYSEITGESGTSAREILEANREVLLQAQEATATPNP